MQKNDDGSRTDHGQVESKKANRLKHLLTGDLPLQNATTFFILISCLDIFMTNVLLRMGAIEANPFANYFYQKWGFNGMIAFKLVLVAFICVIAQVIAIKKVHTGKNVLYLGSFVTGLVVIYSARLFVMTV
jgi:hypothetical protein